MTTQIEVQIGDGTQKPRVVRSGGLWAVIAETTTHVGYGRAVWVRTWDPSDLSKPIDGKGLLVVGPTRRLSPG
jgi:hypothetical protein